MAANTIFPDVLQIAHRVPYPPDKGDRIRTFHLLRFLSRHARVHLACLADEPVTAEQVQMLERYCARVAVVPLGRKTRWLRAAAAMAAGRTASEGAFASRALRRLVRRWARETPFRGCVASASSVAGYLRIPELRGAAAIIDLVDVDSQKWLDYAEAASGFRAWLYRREGMRVRRLETKLAEWSQGLVVVSQAEAGLYRTFGPAAAVQVIPNGVDLDYFRPEHAEEEQACVFVGALDYKPNIDGACWFSREIWPEILRSRPKATLYLVGRQPAAAVRELGQLPRVKVVGQVADVRPWVARSAVVVVPLRLGRGVQNKVLEALAMGKATIASPQALQGINTRAGFHLIRAAAREEWVSSILRFLNRKHLREKLGAAGRAFVEVHHHWDRCLRPFGELLGLPLGPAEPDRREPDLARALEKAALETLVVP